MWYGCFKFIPKYNWGGTVSDDGGLSGAWEATCPNPLHREVTTAADGTMVVARCRRTRAFRSLATEALALRRLRCWCLASTHTASAAAHKEWVQPADDMLPSEADLDARAIVGFPEWRGEKRQAAK